VLTIIGADGTERKASYDLPVDAKLEVHDGGLIGAGQPLAKIDIEAAKTKDITGGLPRVAELFEARAKEKSAVLAKIDGRVESIEGESPKRVVTIVSDDPAEPQEEKHLIKGQQVVVREGDHVKAGDALSDGPLSPHEILAVKSEMAVAEYLVNEIQQVYRLQGVKINDKHIEVIVRQMLRRVRIKDVGDSNFLPDEQVEKWVLDEENARLSRLDEGLRPAIAEPLLLGISKASLATESFISAASFQETTKVLTAAALKGKVDRLHGLKENVIMGRLIPAGTGLKGYRDLSFDTSSESKD
jgi:DNA-directed RNA polymerase subunit beta'